MLTNLKRDNQRLIEENASLTAKLKDSLMKEIKEQRDGSAKEYSLISSARKVSKMVDNSNYTHREESRTMNVGE